MAIDLETKQPPFKQRIAAARVLNIREKQFEN